MIRKGDMKAVDLDPGLRGFQRRCRASLCGLPGHAQIGKGMWAMPDLMADMLEAKIAHPRAGANTAWVPSPTAATLHALHYHKVDVKARQAELPIAQARVDRRHPVHPARRAAELAARRDPGGARQQRAGHSRLCRALDRPGRRLLEGPRHQRCRPDGGPRHAAHLQPAHRQLAAPRHRRRSEQVMETMQRMAAVVDRQNAGDPLYRPMAPSFDGASPSRRPAIWSSRAASSRTATPSRSCMPAGGKRRRGTPAPDGRGSAVWPRTRRSASQARCLHVAPTKVLDAGARQGTGQHRESASHIVAPLSEMRGGKIGLRAQDHAVLQHLQVVRRERRAGRGDVDDGIGECPPPARLPSRRGFPPRDRARCRGWRRSPASGSSISWRCAGAGRGGRGSRRRRRRDPPSSRRRSRAPAPRRRRRRWPKPSGGEQRDLSHRHRRPSRARDPRRSRRDGRAGSQFAGDLRGGEKRHLDLVHAREPAPILAAAALLDRTVRRAREAPPPPPCSRPFDGSARMSAPLLMVPHRPKDRGAS